MANYSKEQNLWWAVIRRAVEDARLPIPLKPWRERETSIVETRNSAVHFIFFDEEWFSTVCRFVETHPNHIRKQALEIGIKPVIVRCKKAA